MTQKKEYTLPVLWHTDAVSGISFSEQASLLWGGRVNPRYSLSG